MKTVRRKRTRRLKRTGSNHAVWEPAGQLWKREGYPDFKNFESSELVKSIGVKNISELVTLNESLSEIAYSYWDRKNDVIDKPPAVFYRSNIKAVEKATRDLLSVLQKPVGLGHTDLAFWFRRLTGRELFNDSDPSSLLSNINSLIGACKAATSQRIGKSGPFNYKHVEEAVASLIAIWESRMGEKFPMSLKAANSQPRTHKGNEACIANPQRDTADRNEAGEAELEFESPSAHFVHTVMRRIDPEISLADIRTALRKCLKQR